MLFERSGKRRAKKEERREKIHTLHSYVFILAISVLVCECALYIIQLFIEYMPIQFFSSKIKTNVSVCPDNYWFTFAFSFTSLLLYIFFVFILTYEYFVAHTQRTSLCVCHPQFLLFKKRKLNQTYVQYNKDQIKRENVFRSERVTMLCYVDNEREKYENQR